MSKLKTYRVGIWEEQSGYVTVEAKNKEEATAIVERGLSDDGVNFFSDFDCTHREIDIVEEAEKQEGGE